MKKVNTEANNVSQRIDYRHMLPDDTKSRNILDHRAQLLSRVNNLDMGDDVNKIHYLKFRLGTSDYYGIPYADIHDVKQADNITKVPHAPNYITGIHYWHGKIISVIDLNKYFQISSNVDKREQAYLSTVSNGKIIMAVIFDDIIGVDSYNNGELQNNIKGTESIDDRHISGIHAGTVCILNIKEIINDIVAKIGQSKGRSHE